MFRLWSGLAGLVATLITPVFDYSSLCQRDDGLREITWSIRKLDRVKSAMILIVKDCGLGVVIEQVFM